ncbi:ficolin-2-like isoform X1 [Oculina patagonica]
MATHMKIGLLTCLLLLMILMEEVKPVLAGHIERLKQRTKILEENMKKMEERMKALEECKACSKIKELNETVSELQEKKPKPDVDECSASISVCDVNADCQNTVGSYICSCKAGFTGDGKTCTDVDECSTSGSVCDVNAECQNTVGSYICSCKAGFTGDGKTCTAVQKDCAELFKTGKQKSGVYAINPDGSNAFDVFCDQTIAGGGWTVFQKRLDGSVDFYRGWDDYKRGFGNLTGEFWLGLEKIHRLTSSGQFKLRVDLEDYAGKTGYAEYDSLAIASEGDKYKLSLGSYSGTSGDSLTYHNGHPFTTKDQNNDPEYYNCAVHYSGAWWYNRCYGTNMNGIYHQGQYKGTDGIIWWAFSGYSVKRAEMKIRPVNF